MPSYEQIQLIGGPCDGETHSWDGGDWFESYEKPPFTAILTRVAPHTGSIKRHTYRRYRDEHGRATTLFFYQGGQ